VQGRVSAARIDGTRQEVRLKASPKRKFTGPTYHLNYVVQEEAHVKLRKMVGSAHIGSFMEELIIREYRRRERRQQLHEGLREKPLKPEVIM
jgi:hypothetical protein